MPKKKVLSVKNTKTPPQKYIYILLVSLIVYYLIKSKAEKQRQREEKQREEIERQREEKEREQTTVERKSMKDYIVPVSLIILLFFSTIYFFIIVQTSNTNTNSKRQNRGDKEKDHEKDQQTKTTNTRNDDAIQTPVSIDESNYYVVYLKSTDMNLIASIIERVYEDIISKREIGNQNIRIDFYKLNVPSNRTGKDRLIKSNLKLNLNNLKGKLNIGVNISIRIFYEFENNIKSYPQISLDEYEYTNLVKYFSPLDSRLRQESGVNIPEYQNGIFVDSELTKESESQNGIDLSNQNLKYIKIDQYYPRFYAVIFTKN